MKKIMLAALAALLFLAPEAEAKSPGRHGHYRHHRRVVVVPPRPRVVVIAPPVLIVPPRPVIVVRPHMRPHRHHPVVMARPHHARIGRPYPGIVVR